MLREAIPQLAEKTGRHIDFLSTREPGGSQGADILRTFIKERWLLAEMAGITPNESTTAELFTLARKLLHEEVIKPFVSAEGNHVICSDRTWMSMIAIQGEFNDGRAGVNLNELMELVRFATDGISPDFVLLRTFDEDSFAAEVSFRQLFTLLDGREIMPKDIGPISDLQRDQNRLLALARRFAGVIDFVKVDAALDPVSSTKQDLEIIAERLCAKMPEYRLELVQSLFGEAIRKLDSEGLFDEMREVMIRQERLREVLERVQMTAFDVMEMLRENHEERGVIEVRDRYNVELGKGGRR